MSLPPTTPFQTRTVAPFFSFPTSLLTVAIAATATTAFFATATSAKLNPTNPTNPINPINPINPANPISTPSSKILHFPIIPHHEVVNRRHRERRSKQRQLEQDEEDYYQHNATLEVGGLYQGYGTHYVDLWVGTPPQRQTVIVDTGSGVTAFPCSGCKDCGSKYHVDAFFQEADSRTFQKFTCDQCVGASCRGAGSSSSYSGGSPRNNWGSAGESGEYCHLSVSYQEGSMWNAYEGQDVTYVGGLHDDFVQKHDHSGTEIGGTIHGEDPLHAADFEFDMVFGCQTKITGLFKTQLADGIMGMCLKPSSIFNQMYNQNIISSPSFSLCFARAEEAEKKGSIAGALSMGGTDTRLHNSQMIYAHGFNTKGVMHGVNLRKIYLMESGQYDASEATPKNTHKVEISTSFLNSGSIIVDSGTTDTYMTRNLKAPFESLFKKVVGYEYSEYGMTLSDEQVSKLPTIIIQIEGREEENKKLGGARDVPGLAGMIDDEWPYDILIAIPPAHYVEYDTDRKKYVGRFSLTEGSGSVLGANTMRGHDVFFDIPESSRIGFAPSDCDYFHLISETDDEVNEDAESNRKQNEESNGDDYYTEDEKELGFNGPEDDDNILHPSTKTVLGHEIESKTFMVVTSILLVGLLGLMTVSIVNRCRSRTEFSTGISGENLDDLHLDTEMEKLPALA